VFINATLFIQLIHFFVAWKLIDRVLLHNAVNAVQSERRKEEELFEAIDKEKSMLLVTIKEKNDEWASFRHIFQRHTPIITISSHRPKGYFDTSNVATSQLPDDETKRAFSHDLETFLYQRIKCVY
jgi:hypothetical protein